MVLWNLQSGDNCLQQHHMKWQHPVKFLGTHFLGPGAKNRIGRETQDMKVEVGMHVKVGAGGRKIWKTSST